MVSTYVTWVVVGAIFLICSGAAKASGNPGAEKAMEIGGQLSLAIAGLVFSYNVLRAAQIIIHQGGF